MSATSTSTRAPRARQINRAICCAALAAAGIFAGDRAFAADITWNRAAGNPGNFGDGVNWVGGVAPGASDSGFINNGGISTIGAAFNGTIINVGLGSAAAGTGTLTQTGGSLVASGNATFGGDTTGAGTFIMSGGTLTATGGGVSGSISFGGDGAGTANISGGFIGARNFFLGLNAHGHGHVVQTGGQISVSQKFVMAELKPADFAATPTPSDYTMSGGGISVGGSMYIGAHGPSTFNLSNTGSINVVGAVQIGASGGDSDPPAGTGTINMSGGTINVSGPGAFVVVADHGDGTLNLSGGSITTKYYNIGQNFEAGFSTRGVVNHTGGSATAEFSWVIAEQSQSANLYDLSGGTVTVVGAGIPELPGDLNIASSADSRGTLIVRGTGVARIGNSALVGNGANSGGTLIVSSGGSVTLGFNGGGTGNLIVGVDGAGTLQISGGNVLADNMTLGQNATAVGIGSQTGGSVVIRNNMSVGETSTGNNVYDIAGGSLTVGTGGVGGIFVASSGVGTLRVGGTANVSAPALSNKGAYAQTGGVASLGLVTGTGSISVSGGTLNATSIAQGTLSISGTGTARIAVNGTNTGLSIVDNLSVTGSGRLDLNDNDMIVHNGSYAAVSTSIRNARNGGLWNGAGITSSTAAAANPKNKTLGTVTGAQYIAAQGAGAQFDGVVVASSDLLVKYTYYGDADLNGIVNFDDYSRIDAGFNGGGTDWFRGDFDYNGSVNFDDYSLIDNAFNTQSGTLRRAMSYLDGSDRDQRTMTAAALQLVVNHFEQFGQPYATGFLNAVPEPTAALAALAALATVHRRRRRGNT